MTYLPETLFALLFTLCGVWILCVIRFARLLFDGHPETYDELGLWDLWPHDVGGWIRGFDNSRPTFALLGFLFRGTFRDLGDPSVSRLASYMRVHFVVTMIVFPITLVVITKSLLAEPPRRPTVVQVEEIEPPAAPSEAEVLYQRGIGHWRNNEHDLALEDFYAVIKREPSHFEAHRNADRLLSQKRRFGEVVSLWSAYLAREPRDAEAYYERGGAYYHLQDYAAARQDAARACELGKPEACKQAERMKGL